MAEKIMDLNKWIYMGQVNTWNSCRYGYVKGDLYCREIGNVMFYSLVVNGISYHVSKNLSHQPDRYSHEANGLLFTI